MCEGKPSLLFEYESWNIIWINWQLFQSSLKAIVVCVYVWAQPFSLSLFIFCTFVNFHFHKSRSRYRKRDDRGHWAKAMLMKASLIIDLSAGVVTIIPFRLWKEELQFLLIGLKISHETTQNDILKYFRMALQIPCRNNK